MPEPLSRRSVEIDQGLKSGLPGNTARLDKWYQQQAEQHGFMLDEAQLGAIVHFQRLYDELAASGKNGWLGKLFGGAKAIRGVYLWGGVGRGKSFLMDGFFACAPVEKKRRQHFHRFMQWVHAELKTLDRVSDPLAAVARRIAGNTRLLCFDEFHVSDIGDAMLLGRLLRELLDQGVVLVATSNTRPDDLYRDGLQQSRFQPAIALLKEKLEVVEVDGGADYRLRALEKVEIYHWPLDAVAEANLDSAYWSLAGESGKGVAALEIAGRRILARRLAPGIAWFNFFDLCSGPRGQADYIEIARRFHTVLVSGIPLLDEDREEEALRLTWLIDEFYDRRVKLVVSAQAPPQALYHGRRNPAEFARAASRLVEMQTRQYLAQPHSP